MDLSKKLKKKYNDLHKMYSMMKVKKASRNKKKKNTLNNVLTSEQKKEIKKYFKEYKNVNYIFHNFYTEKTGKFYVNYLPDDFYFCYIDMYYNNWNIASVLDNKCFYNRFLPDVKQPDVFAYRINNIWYDEKMTPISLNEILEKMQKEKELFIKEAYDSAGGHGVTYIKIDDNANNKFYECINKIDVDIVIQKALKQSKTLAKINESSVNTIRILSMLNKDGTVKIYSSILRMGINGSKVDNASSGGITCGINADGTLKKVAYKVNGEKYFKHPTSGIEFGNIRIPKFKEMEELVEKNHPLLPMSRLISWDLTLNENDEIVLIEFGLRYGELDFHQLNNGPVFGKDTKKILDEVFKK